MVASCYSVLMLEKGDNSFDHLRTTFQFEETLSIFGGTFALLEMIHE